MYTFPKFEKKSKFQIKFEKVLFLELGPAPVFGQAVAHFLFFPNRLALPLPTRPRPLGRPSWLRVGGALPGHLPPWADRRCPFLSDARLPRSPSNPIKGAPASAPPPLLLALFQSLEQPCTGALPATAF
jgi:hypothetical protein